MTVRHLIFLVLSASTLAHAGSAAGPTFDPKAFQKRFEKADIDKDGKLTREEAYAEFPRMPEYFDEIDANGDGRITLREVRSAMEKRVNAALDASKSGKRYLVPSPPAGSAAGSPANPRYFPDRQAATRHFRSEHYQSLESPHPPVSSADEPLHSIQAPAQIKKSF